MTPHLPHILLLTATSGTSSLLWIVLGIILFSILILLPGFFLMPLSASRPAPPEVLPFPVITLGRDSSNQMVLDAPTVSAHHCRLEITEEAWASR